MNHKLNFYIASGSSQTLTKFPGVQELIKDLALHAHRLGEEQQNDAREERPLASQEATLCPLFAFGNKASGRDFSRSICMGKVRKQRENCHLSQNHQHCPSAIPTQNIINPACLLRGTNSMSTKSIACISGRVPHCIQLQWAGQGAGSFPWPYREASRCRNNPRFGRTCKRPA